jgi:hypothetical protein
MSSGDMTLVDDIGSVQLSIQSAIRGAFKTNDSMKLFSDKESASLRSRLKGLSADYKLGRIDRPSFDKQALEIVRTLQSIGESLLPAEIDILNQVFLR